MSCLESQNMIFRPCLVTGAFNLLPSDAERRIIGDAAFLHGPLEHGAQRVEKIALRKWRRRLLIDDALHVLAS